MSRQISDSSVKGLEISGEHGLTIFTGDPDISENAAVSIGEDGVTDFANMPTVNGVVIDSSEAIAVVTVCQSNDPAGDNYRIQDITYQNTSGRTMYVAITASTTTTTGEVEGTIQIGSSEGPGLFAVVDNDSTVVDGQIESLAFGHHVPDQYYYILSTNAGEFTVNSWTETLL